MEIYLIRHTTPLIEKGTCYGQADLDVTESFAAEASCIRSHIPEGIAEVYSSPLKRCRQLAEHLFPSHTIRFEERLKEINCGEWELKLWNEIDGVLLQSWMADFVNVGIPGGESYLDLYHRVSSWFDALPERKAVAIVAHGGVIRSILSHINGVALKDSFEQFRLRYGCVVKVVREKNRFQHHILHNPFAEEEQHRPTKE
jgi:alpha-ribazole phosphatase